METTQLEPREGFDLDARVEDDLDSDPTEFSCYSAEDVEAWRRGDWHYVTVVVTASRAGVELGWSSLSGVESGIMADGYADPFKHTLDDYYDLPGEAIENARRKIAEICGG